MIDFIILGFIFIGLGYFYWMSRSNIFLIFSVILIGLYFLNIPYNYYCFHLMILGLGVYEILIDSKLKIIRLIGLFLFLTVFIFQIFNIASEFITVLLRFITLALFLIHVFVSMRKGELKYNIYVITLTGVTIDLILNSLNFISIE